MFLLENRILICVIILIIAVLFVLLIPLWKKLCKTDFGAKVFTAIGLALMILIALI